MIIGLPRHPNYLSQDPESNSRTFLEQFALVCFYLDIFVSRQEDLCVEGLRSLWTGEDDCGAYRGQVSLFQPWQEAT